MKNKYSNPLKVLSSLFIVMLIAASSYGQVTKTLDLGEFSSISLNADYKVNLRQSNVQEVTAKVDPEIWSATNIWVDNGTLYIDMKPTETGKTNILKKLENKLSSTMELDITVKNLRKIIVNSNGSITTGNSINASVLEIEMNGGGRINMDVRSSRLNASIYSPGEIQLTGYTDNLVLMAAGNGVFNGANFDVKRVEANARGMETTCSLKVSESININIYGGAEVLYSGAAKNITKHIYGSGSVLFRN